MKLRRLFITMKRAMYSTCRFPSYFCMLYLSQPNNKNLLPEVFGSAVFIYLTTPMSIDFHMVILGPYAIPTKLQRFSVKICCPYIKLSKKSLQVVKKVVVCMGENCIFCSFVCSVRRPLGSHFYGISSSVYKIYFSLYD